MDGVHSTTRRKFLMQSAGALAGGAIIVLADPAPSRATPEDMLAAIRKLTGGKPVNKGRVTLEIPPLVENGNSVSMSIAVDSPMTEADFVKSIHVFNEKNPQPHVISLMLGPRAGRATMQTRIRLADSQTITAIAEMNDGSFWRGEADVIVTIAACLEDL